MNIEKFRVKENVALLGLLMTLISGCTVQSSQSPTQVLASPEATRIHLAPIDQEALSEGICTRIVTLLDDGAPLIGAGRYLPNQILGPLVVDAGNEIEIDLDNATGVDIMVALGEIDFSGGIPTNCTEVVGDILEG